jgi:hypothetical protein
MAENEPKSTIDLSVYLDTPKVFKGGSPRIIEISYVFFLVQLPFMAQQPQAIRRSPRST